MIELKKRVLISAHMGSCGYNLPGNTYASFAVALRQGADIIELDVTKSADDVLFVFHPKTEKIRLARISISARCLLPRSKSCTLSTWTAIPPSTP